MKNPFVCVYDLNLFSGRVIGDILGCHPKVILGGRVHENPYYLPPDEFLRFKGRQVTPGRLRWCYSAFVH